MELMFQLNRKKTTDIYLEHRLIRREHDTSEELI